MQKECEELEKLIQRDVDSKSSILSLSEFVAINYILSELQGLGKYEPKE